ncbi:MAG: ribose 5-phosphate isomerase B [Chloroflexi bacterium]|nr:ribose 5-phosphate isomerase B [Chloroflexota bacterium]
MSDKIDDAELHRIVQRVLGKVMGNTDPAQPAPNPPPGAAISAGKKVVVIGADHGGFELKDILKTEISRLGYEIIDVGTNSKDAVDYPDFAHAVAQLVSTGKAWRGIMIDGAGIGSCIVANKVPGVRAGMAYDISSANNSREHNDTNVLTLGAGLIGANLAKQIVKVWLTTEFGGDRHQKRIDKIKSVEKQYLK